MRITEPNIAKGAMLQAQVPIWVEKRARLKFSFGEYHLFSFWFPAVVLDTHFSRVSETADSIATSMAIPSHVQALVLAPFILSGPVRKLRFLKGRMAYVPSQHRQFYVDMTGSFEDYLNGFSSKSRSTLLRKVKKFGEACGGALDFREYRSASEMEEFYRLARSVSERTYQERLLDAGLPDSEAFRTEMRRRAEADSVRAYLLFKDGAPVAYLYSPERDSVLIYQYLGYDPALSQLSPGAVLQFLAFKRLYAEARFQKFDFTQGGGQHKETFATGSWDCGDLFYFRKNARNLAMVSAHIALTAVSDGVSWLASRMGIKRRLKQFLRKA